MKSCVTDWRRLGVAIAMLVCGCEGTIAGGLTPEVNEDDDAVEDPYEDSDSVGDPDANSLPAPMVEQTFAPSATDLLNPERGFYVGYDLRSPSEAAEVRASGHTMAIALVRLDAYRDAPLDAALLDDLDEGFAAARASGIKLILRFMYNSSFSDDAPKARILGHIAQLEPMLRDNADVIAVMQAGFIGAWGEWHGSTNGLDNDADRADILGALLAALPSSRCVQVRTPMYKEAIFPGGPLTDVEAFTESDRARVGHHNDCFLASESDMGTYAAPVSEWEGYVASDTRFTAMGGETCALYEPRVNCDAAVSNMEALHFSYLNRQYHQGVIDLWEAQGCEGEIRRRLGYRFELRRAAYTGQVAPGGELSLEIELTNAGFAAPFNRRPVYIVLRGAGGQRAVQLTGLDARRWEPGETVTIATRLRVPADLAPDRYTVALWLPDDADALANDPRYAVRFANEGVWDAAAGDNVLTHELVVDPAAPGPMDPAAGDLVELP